MGILGGGLKFSAARNINITENYIRKQLPQENIIDIHNYVMNYIRNTQFPNLTSIENTELAASKMVKNKKELLSDISRYGKVKLPVIYARYNKLYDVKELMEGQLGNLANQLNEKYKTHTDIISSNDFGYDLDEAYFDMQIEERYGSAYTLDFITLLTQIMAFEIDNKITKYDMLEALRIIFEGVADTKLKRQCLHFYNVEVYTVFNVIKAISPSIFFRIIDFRFDSDFDWPYKDNLMEILNDRLKLFRFSENTVNKMQLIGTNKYDDIDIGSAIHILVIKRALELYMSKKIGGDTSDK